MKLFKSSILAIFALATGAAFTSCSDDHNIVEGGEEGVYIAHDVNAKTLSIPAEDAAPEITLTIGRLSTNDPSEVPVILEDPSGIFSAPEAVTFEGDALTTTYTITYDNAAIEEDVAYPVTIKLGVDIARTSHYGPYELSVNLVRASSWVSLGKGIYYDNLIAESLYKFDPVQYEVEILQNPKNPTSYRVVNPYGSAYPYFEEGKYDGETHYLELDCSDPERVNFVGEFHTGFDLGDGEIWFISFVDYFLSKGFTPDEIAEAGYYGTFEDGVIRFSTPQSLLAAIGNDGFYYANNSGEFFVALPGAVLTDYSAELSYVGRLAGADNLDYILADVQLGEDVESARVAAALTNDVEAVASAILNDEIEYVEISESGQVKLPISESGTYSVVAITYGAGEPQELSYITVKVELGGSDWEDAGTAYIADGWLIGGAGYDPMTYVWETTYQTSASNPGVVRLVNLYGAETSPVVNFATGKFDIDINISDPEFVIIEPQCTGNNFFEDGTAYISEADYCYVNIAGYTAEDVIGAGLNTTYDAAEGMITVNKCFLNFGGADWYITKSQSLIQLVAGEVAASKSATVSKSLKSATKGAGSRLNHVATWNIGGVRKVAAKAVLK
ncbi:MAG: hypothetical protein ACI31F_01710 [Muribaculaceae bacterium]